MLDFLIEQQLEDLKPKNLKVLVGMSIHSSVDMETKDCMFKP